MTVLAQTGSKLPLCSLWLYKCHPDPEKLNKVYSNMRIQSNKIIWKVKIGMRGVEKIIENWLCASDYLDQ
jgi:hypothetical protein